MVLFGSQRGPSQLIDCLTEKKKKKSSSRRSSEIQPLYCAQLPIYPSSRTTGGLGPYIDHRIVAGPAAECCGELAKPGKEENKRGGVDDG